MPADGASGGERAEGAADAELSYGEALAELERILLELEDDRVDIDALAQKVRRAATLIERCRARIADARMEVDRIVGTLDAEA